MLMPGQEPAAVNREIAYASGISVVPPVPFRQQVAPAQAVPGESPFIPPLVTSRRSRRSTRKLEITLLSENPAVSKVTSGKKNGKV